jgi:hypothetical protein
MDYTVKPDIDVVVGPPYRCMTQRSHTDDRVGATESKFYIPAATPSSVASRVERLWATLFSHGIETPG